MVVNQPYQYTVEIERTCKLFSGNTTSNTYIPSTTISPEMATRTSTFECDVEVCLMAYQSKIDGGSPRFHRCHAIRRLVTCMQRVPIYCSVKDHRFRYINSKRKLATSRIKCPPSGAVWTWRDLVVAFFCSCPWLKCCFSL